MGKLSVQLIVVYNVIKNLSTEVLKDLSAIVQTSNNSSTVTRIDTSPQLQLTSGCSIRIAKNTKQTHAEGPAQEGKDVASLSELFC